MTPPHHAMAPHLETPRLRLRAHGLSDFEDLASMWGHPDVTRQIGGRPQTREESWARLLRYSGLWPLLGFGYWAVVDRDTGRFVGDVGFADFHRDMTPPLGDTPEAGWVLSPWAHGRGLATEAMTAVLAWSDAHRSWKETVCIIDVGNEASVRVARKCGYVPRGAGEYKGSTVQVLRRPAPVDVSSLGGAVATRPANQ